jgi:hypothetical protein
MKGLQWIRSWLGSGERPPPERAPDPRPNPPDEPALEALSEEPELPPDPRAELLEKDEEKREKESGPGRYDPL